MTKTEVLEQLKACGSEQTRRTYARHCVTGDVYGVRYGDLNKLVRKIGTDQALAEQLWASGNHDARVLAGMIADPDAITAKTLDAWARSVDNPLLVDAVGGLAAKSPAGRRVIEKWMQSPKEWLAAAGWHALAAMSCLTDVPLTNDQLTDHLEQIEAHIHTSPNRVRYTMNNALIAIGVRNATLQKRALAAAKRIGKVDVDHGDTNCKTPDATVYIQKTVARRGTKPKARKRVTKKQTAR